MRLGLVATAAPAPRRGERGWMRGLAGALALGVAGWMAPFAAGAADAGARRYDLAAGEAAEVLQEFVARHGLQFVFPVRTVRGVRTQPLHGEYTIAEALDRLLAGTGLEVVRDADTGAYLLRRKAVPAATEAAPVPAVSAPKPTAAEPPAALPAVNVERGRIGDATQSILPTNRIAPLYHHVITRAEIDQSGVTTLAEFLTTVPGYSGEGPESLQASADLKLTTGANVYGGSFLKLRGWDSQHTTVLLNGRELPPSPESRGPDLSRIPLAAVERIDVLPFAGSALYGDGAVGGAMNIVLRRDFAGSFASLQVGDSTRGGGSETFLTWVEGLASTDGKTKATLIGDFQRRGALRLGDRNFLARATNRLRPGRTLLPADASGTDQRALLGALVTGEPGMFAIAEAGSDLGIPGRTGAYFAVAPAGRNAATLPRNLQFEHTREPDVLEFYGEIGFNRAVEAFAAPEQIEPLTLDPRDPRNPFRADLPDFAGRSVTWYFDPVDLPDARFRQVRDSARVVLGVRGAVSRRWHWSLDTFGDVSRALTMIDGYGASLNEVLRRWTAAQSSQFSAIYDPLADHRTAPLPVEQRERLLARRSWLDYRSRMLGAEARIAGHAYDLPAGALRTSFGLEYEWRDHVTRQKTDASRELFARLDALGSYDSLTQLSRTSDNGERLGAVIEALAPLWKEGMRGLPLHRVDLNVASRVARTDGGHGALSNLAALKVALSPSWALRGTWSQGYVAPSSLVANSPMVETSTLTSFVDPLRGNIRQLYPVRIVSGGGLEQRPETSQARVAGVLFTPAGAPGLFLSVDAWSITMRDRLRAPTVQELASHPDFFAGKIQREAPLGWELALGWSGAVKRVDLRPVRVTHLRSDGADLALRYQLPPTRAGTFTLSSQVEAVWRYEEQLLPVTPAVDKVNVVTDSAADGLMDSAVVSPRVRTTLAWQRHAWFASVTAAYTPHYRSETTTPTAALPSATGVDGDWIGSSTRWDLQAGYTVPRAAHGARSGWSDTTWTLGIRNVFDRAPAVRSDGTSFYSRLDDPRMRFVYGRVQWRR
ncbi:MAG: TonB-dependent receptor [Verrucomicrobia bacterium]|nr:TonB-dependent receptor [Verrucomicrobiota bacterium]